MCNSNRDFFNGVAPEWDSMIEVDDRKIGHILDVARLCEGDSVLDIGSGTGVLIPYMAERVGRVGKIDAVDISDGMLDVAKKKFGSLPFVRFILSDVENDTIEGQYDHIMMYCMYPHLDSPEETVEWLVKVNLKPGGNLVIAFPESKENINGIHHHNDGSVHSEHLLAAYLLKANLAMRGLDVDYMEDNDYFYIIRITK